MCCTEEMALEMHLTEGYDLQKTEHKGLCDIVKYRMHRQPPTQLTAENVL